MSVAQAHNGVFTYTYDDVSISTRAQSTIEIEDSEVLQMVFDKGRSGNGTVGTDNSSASDSMTVTLQSVSDSLEALWKRSYDEIRAGSGKRATAIFTPNNNPSNKREIISAAPQNRTMQTSISSNIEDPFTLTIIGKLGTIKEGTGE